MATSDDSAFFLVEHHVQDKKAYDDWFAGMMKSFEGKSFQEHSDDPIWKGNQCVLTASSEDGQEAVCVWKIPAGSTESDFQTFIDDFTGGNYVKNVVHEVQASMGLQNLNKEVYIKDLMKVGKEGSVQGFADDGELFFVHHNVLSKEAWDKTFASKVNDVKGKSTAKDITEAWKVGDGVKGVSNIGLGDDHSVCLWSMPKGTTDSQFQAMIDEFLGTVARNDVFKIEQSTCVGSRALHPDFFAQELIAYANSA